MWLSRGPQRRRVAQALARLGHGERDGRTPVGRLSPGLQQVVEIARALVHNARIVVFDEPTSSLPLSDVRRLFETIRRLKAAGLGIVYISHFLEEVREIADRYSVLRDGQTVGAGRLADVTDSQIVSLMVGRTVEELFPHVPHSAGETVLSIQQLSGRRSPHGVSFELRRGEILGIAGLVGAGRTELLRCLYGLDPTHVGRVTIYQRGGGALPLCGESTERIRAGVGFVSEDRKNEGLAQPLSIADNLTLSRIAPYSRFGLLRRGARSRAVAEWMARLAVKARDAEQPVSDLSGGNQQKVAIARVLHEQADVLLLDEPTRGIDVGTKAEIYRLIGELAAGGKAILFVSSYLPELLAVCDRVGVMRRGRLIEIRPVDGWTEEGLLAAAVGSEEVAT
jgi:ribose transport system ATP-binding protein